jgi:integrase
LQIISNEREVKRLKPQLDQNQKPKSAEFRVKGTKNLVLRLTPAGGKTWSYNYRPEPKVRRKIALGTFPAVSLADARTKAAELAVQIAKGIDPQAKEEEKALAQTFEEVADLYLMTHEKKLAKSNGQLSSWSIEARRILDKDIIPFIGTKHLDEVTKQDIVVLVDRKIDPERNRGHCAADMVLGVINAVYEWARGRGYTEAEPSRGLKKYKLSQERDRVLTDDELRSLWSSIERAPQMDEGTKDALRLELLIGLRVREVTEAPKAEIDLDRKLWTVPGDRTKNGKELRLPLSDFAIRIIKGAMVRAGNSPWLFPSPILPGQPLRKQSVSRAMWRHRQRKGSDLTDVRTHDLRRTAATSLGEMGVMGDVIERFLNHTPQGVTRRHYNHATYEGPLREALDAWAAKLEGIVGLST